MQSNPSTWLALLALTVISLSVLTEAVVPTLPKFVTPEEQRELLAVAELGVSDYLNNQSSFTPQPRYDSEQSIAYVIFWRNHKKVHAWWVSTSNLSLSVYKAALENAKRGQIASSDGLMIHVEVLGVKVPLSARGYNHGANALKFEQENKAFIYYSAILIENNLKLGAAATRLRNRFTDSSSEIREYFVPTQHFAKYVDQDRIIDFFRANTPALSLNVTEESFYETKALATKHLINTMRPAGNFHYQYQPSQDRFLNDDNLIRQMLASRAVALFAIADAKYMDAHKQNLEHALQHYYQQDGDNGILVMGPKVKLGGIGLMLRLLAHSPFLDQYASQARSLYNTIKSMQNEDGSLKPFYRVKPGLAVDENRALYFYSGEAILGLVEYGLKIGDDEVLATAVKSQDKYVDLYVDHLEEHYYPAYVPWHTMSLNKLFFRFKTPRYADAIFTLNDKLLEIQNQNTTEQFVPDIVGRFFNTSTPQYGYPHSSSDGVYVEGLAYAYEIAKAMGDTERMARYYHAIVLGLHNLQNLQYRDDRMYFVPKPEEVDGAIRVSVTSSDIRIDTTAHSMDAFAKIEELLRNGLLLLPE